MLSVLTIVTFTDNIAKEYSVQQLKGNASLKVTVSLAFEGSILVGQEPGTGKEK